MTTDFLHDRPPSVNQQYFSRYRPEQAFGDPEVKALDFLDFRHCEGGKVVTVTHSLNQQYVTKYACKISEAGLSPWRHGFISGLCGIYAR
jgi:hypothetical protein